MIAITLLVVACAIGASTQSCPPESGIYLMYKGECFNNNSYFREMDLHGVQNGLQCLLAGNEESVTEPTGKWLYPAGNVVNCPTSTSHSDPFRCQAGSNNGDNGVTLYKSSTTAIGTNVGVYSCCLPGTCDDGASERLTVQIFQTEFITDLYLTPPQVITVAPQMYTVHCVYANSASPSPSIEYYMEQSYPLTAVEECNTNLPGLSCTNQLNSTTGPVLDSQFLATWDASTVIEAGRYFPFDKAADGDHDYQCSSSHMNMVQSAYITVRAPNFSPLNPSACAWTSTSVELSWAWPDALPDADGYVIYYNSGSESDTSVKVEGGSVSEYTLEGLVPSTTYTITLRAYQDLLGPISASAQVDTIPPEITINHTLVQDISSTSLHYRVQCFTSVLVPDQLSWFINGEEASPENYTTFSEVIDSASNTNNHSIMVDVDLTSSATIACTAIFGGCDFSRSVTITATGSPPENVEAAINSPSGISVMWSPPAGESAVAGYGVIYATDTSVVEQASMPAAQISDLTQGLLYTISVFAYNVSLPTPPSDQIQVLFSDPGTVTALTGSVDSWNSISIDWSPPTLSGSVVSSYHIMYTTTCPESSDTDSGNVTILADQTHHQFLSLKGNVTYTFSVTAVNIIGSSDPMYINQTTTAFAPSAPPESVSAEAVSYNVVHVTWGEVPCLERNGYITGYMVRVSADGEDVNTTSVGITTTATVTGLSPLQTYTVRVAAISGQGTGPHSQPAFVTTPLTIPGPVLSLTVSSIEPTSATVSWNTPDTLGPLVDSYIVQYSSSCEDQLISKSLSVNNQTLSVKLTDVEEALNYTISVTARNTMGDGETVTTWHYSSPTAPSAPPNTVIAEEVSYDTVQVTWGEVPCLEHNGLITGYVVKVSSNGVSVNTTSVGITTTATVTGLSPLQTYTVSVAAVNGEGTGPHSSPAFVTTPLTIPGPVLSLTVSSIEPTYITVSWSTPDTLGPLVDSYIIQYSTSCEGQLISKLLSVNNQTLSVDLTDVEEAQNYTISVTARNTMGDGKNVTTWYYSSPTAPSAPPKNVIAEAISYEAVEVTWGEVPCLERNGLTTGYVVEVSVSGEAVNTTSVGITTTATVTGLSPLQTYTVSVAAVNGQGTGPHSSPAAVTTLQTVPGQVIALTALNIEPTSITVSWSAPVTLGPLIDSYIIQYSTSCEGQLISKSLSRNNQTLSVELVDVEEAQNYTISVTARNTVGDGESVTIWHKTLPFAPSAPPESVSAEAVSYDAVQVTWGEVPCLEHNGLITGYVVKVSINGEAVNTTSVGITTTATVTGLSPLQTYTVSVAAVNGEGTGPHSSPAVVTTYLTVPGPILAVMGSTINQTTISVSWSPPDTLGPLVDTYIIQYSTSCEGDLISKSLSIDNRTLSIELTDLEEGQNYTISVTARNTVGDGETVTLLGETESSVPSAPPSNVYVIANSNSSMNISWSELECFLRNGPITGYNVSVIGGRDNFNTVTETPDIKIDGLTQIAYNISIAAMNTDGTGPYTDPLHIVLREVPGVVNSLTAKSLDTTLVLVSWIPPSYQATGIIHYEVAYSEAASCSSDDFDELAARSEYFPAENLTANITGLEPSTCYVFSVRAYSSDGPGEWITVTETLFSLTTDAPTVVAEPSLTSTTVLTGTPRASPSYALAIGCAVAAAVLVLLILTVMMMVMVLAWRRRKLRSLTMKAAFMHDTSDDFKKSMEMYSLDSSLDVDGMYAKVGPIIETPAVDGEYLEPHDEYDYASVAPKYQRRRRTPFDPQIPLTYPVPLRKLGSYVAKCHLNDNEIFGQQFEELYSGLDRLSTVGLTSDKKSLNRSKNIIPYDNNRIVVSDHQGHEKIYVNASYIDGFTSARKFIASQAPMKKTVIDFWRMVWQERPQIIAMITNLSEGGKSKCEQYWPAAKVVPQKFGPFTVTLIDEQVQPDVVLRKLKIWVGEDSSQFHHVTQYQFVSWPDHGIPEYPTSLMTLHKRVMSGWSPEGGPILVHCSAGVGRTGTFIALDLALEQADQRGEVDIAGITNRLRQQRMKMVQTEDQYVFLHDTTLEALLCGNTEISSDMFFSKVLSLKHVHPRNGRTILQNQFEVLTYTTPRHTDVLCSVAKQNMEKNRHGLHYFPSDNRRVLLAGQQPGYIHASFVTGYKKEDKFIIAQNPMKSTANDFWKMIIDQEVPAIVMLGCPEEVSRVRDNCYPYWGSGCGVEEQFGDFFVEVVAENGKKGAFIKRELFIKVCKGELAEFHRVTQFQVLDWPQDGHVIEANTILEVIENVTGIQKRRGGGPVVVHCSDTVSRSGVYCAASNALEQCKTEGVVDVFQAVKAVRRQKAEAVTSVEQYASIFDLINSHISMQSPYSCC